MIKRKTAIASNGALAKRRQARSVASTPSDSAPPAGVMPLVHIQVAITQFQDLTVPQPSMWPVCEYNLKLLTRHPNVSLWRRKVVGDSPCRQILKVRNEGAILRFAFTDVIQGRIYRPVGIALARRRAKKPLVAVYPSSGHQQGAYSPFSDLELNGWTLQLTDTLPPLKPAATLKSHFRCFQGGMFLQRTHGGSIGCILFFLENQDSGSVDNDNEEPEPDDASELSEEEGEEE